jgi:hypothetical protein
MIKKTKNIASFLKWQTDLYYLYLVTLEYVFVDKSDY